MRHETSLRNPRIAVLILGLIVLGGFGGASPAAAQRLSPPAANLQKALDRYQAIEKQGGWPTVPGAVMLRAGSSGAAVEQLRKRLAATKDLTAANTESRTYDGDLAAAVTRFQTRHGLVADGIVGPRTRAALNVPVTTRIRQIAANLDRLKSLPGADGKRAILVNVTADSLVVTEEDRIAFTSPVIVGHLAGPADAFTSAVSKVIVNPYWNIPRYIAVKDILPRVQRDPSYLRAQSIRVYRADDSARIEIPPESIDWKPLNSSNFPYALVQDPGPANALGRVEFALPENQNIFLHDSPAQELLGRGQRSIRAGCIRVGKALELAEYLLRRDGLSSFRAMAEALQRRETRQIDLKAPVPLNIVFLSVWADPDGRVQFREEGEMPVGKLAGSPSPGNRAAASGTSACA